MTDRLKGYVVTLDHDIRTDDAEEITKAIAMIKGVLRVDPVLADTGDTMNRARMKAELSEKLWGVLKDF